jgi:hypothetical protein
MYFVKVWSQQQHLFNNGVSWWCILKIGAIETSSRVKNLIYQLNQDIHISRKSIEYGFHWCIRFNSLVRTFRDTFIQSSKTKNRVDQQFGLNKWGEDFVQTTQFLHQWEAGKKLYLLILRIIVINVLEKNWSASVVAVSGEGFLNFSFFTQYLWGSWCLLHQS